MKVELYAPIKIEGPTCFFCSKKIAGTGSMTERCEFYCSRKCAELHYVFTVDGLGNKDELVDVDTSGKVRLVFKKERRG